MAQVTPPSRAAFDQWFPLVIDQGMVPLCTSAVVTAIAAYFERRARNRRFTPSLLFNYRLSRRLSGDPDRKGSHILFALAAWERYGLADEAHWSFRPDRIDIDPPAEIFPDTSEQPSIFYWRVSRSATESQAYLNAMKAAIAIGLPLIIEFPLYISQFSSFDTGILPLPNPLERPLGIHVALLVGYDDNRPLGINVRDGSHLQGGLLMRNSWGSNWGDTGYGWMPYEYVERGLVRASWLVAEREWKTPPTGNSDP